MLGGACLQPEENDARLKSATKQRKEKHASGKYMCKRVFAFLALKDVW